MTSNPMVGKHGAGGSVPDLRHVAVEAVAAGIDGAGGSTRLGLLAGALTPGSGSRMTLQTLRLVMRGRGLDILVRVMTGHATEHVATLGIASAAEERPGLKADEVRLIGG